MTNRGAAPITDESFFDLIMAFSAKFPDVRVQIEFSSRLADLRREGYDVALRATYKIEPGLVARTLRCAQRLQSRGAGCPCRLYVDALTMTSSRQEFIQIAQRDAATDRTWSRSAR